MSVSEGAKELLDHGSIREEPLVQDEDIGSLLNVAALTWNRVRKRRVKTSGGPMESIERWESEARCLSQAE